jgi:hypothetical protein
LSPRDNEFRVAGRLSDETRAAFRDMKVIDVPAETLIYGGIADESHLLGELALIQSLGLRVVSMNQIPDGSGWDRREEAALFFTVFARAVRRLLLHESGAWPAVRRHRLKIEKVEGCAPPVTGTGVS